MSLPDYLARSFKLALAQPQLKWFGAWLVAVAEACVGPLDHEGDDRFALVEELGRPMRLGRWSELEVSDLDRCQAALREQNLERALEYFPHVFVGQAVMLKIAYEWVLRWLAFAPPEAVAPGNQTFEASFSEPEREVGQSILHIFTPQPESVSGPMTRLEERFPWLGQGYAQVVEGAHWAQLSKTSLTIVPPVWPAHKLCCMRMTS